MSSHSNNNIRHCGGYILYVRSYCISARRYISINEVTKERPHLQSIAVSSNIGIKHGFSCINIRQVPWEMLKTEAVVFNTSQGIWRMIMHWKTMFDRYYCIKTQNICYISRYFWHYFVSPFHRCLVNVIFTMLVLGPGQYTSRDGSNSMAPVRTYWKLRSRALTARELPC